MLTTNEKNKNKIAFNATKGIFKDALINDIADMTDENIKSVSNIISNYYAQLENPALFMAISDEGLMLTDKSLTSIKTIFQIIDTKNLNSSKANFKQMATIINQIHNNGRLFRNIIHKYLRNTNEFIDKNTLFNLQPEILKEHDKNTFITKRWSQISNILDKASSIAYTDIKLLVNSTSKILQRITAFIEVIKTGLEKITTHIKSFVERKIEGEKLKFIEITNRLTQQILERSNIHVLTQILKLNRQTYYLLN